jgi:hypothetical protein
MSNMLAVAPADSLGDQILKRHAIASTPLLGDDKRIAFGPWEFTDRDEGLLPVL